MIYIDFYRVYAIMKVSRSIDYPEGIIMNETQFPSMTREHLVTQVTTHDTKWTNSPNSTTYRIRIRLGLNWREYYLVQYSPTDLAAESTEQVIRMAEVVGDAVQRVLIGRSWYEVALRD